MNSNIKLKPCPFCGGEAEIKGDVTFFVECKNIYCVARTDRAIRTEYAANKWNRRINDDNISCANELRYERDSAISDMESMANSSPFGRCAYCKHRRDDNCRHSEGDGKCFEWRGV